MADFLLIAAACVLTMVALGLTRILRGHHAVGVVRSAQDADEPERDHRQHEGRCDEQKISHGVALR